MHYFFEKEIEGTLSVDILRVSFAKIFGWNLDYIDNLSISELMTVQGVLDGLNQYEEKMSQR